VIHVIEFNRMLHIAMHCGQPAVMCADNSFSEFPTVTDKPTVIIGGIGPVGALHQLNVKPINASGVSKCGLANRFT
jgi:hypothetical protein